MKRMKPSDAWEAIADVLEGLRDMPTLYDDLLSKWTAPGLCSVVGCMFDDDLLSLSAKIFMLDQIEDEFTRRGMKPSMDGYGYLFPEGLWKPRAALARQLAKQARLKRR